MTLLQSILLGIIQGLTEFLPISSSGHLVIVPFLLGWDIPENEAFVFDVLVQVATLAAVIVYFWQDLLTIAKAFIAGLASRRPFAEPASRLGWFIILATIPAGLVGLAIKDLVEAAFASPAFTGAALLVTAVLLVAAERANHRSLCLEQLTWQKALWTGVFQALSIFPGVSRSGSTIVGGMTAGLRRPEAARFSFLMSIPIMLAAGLVSMLDLAEIPDLGGTLATFLPGFITAAVVGYLAIRWLIGYLSRRPLYIFSAYCVLMGLLVIGVSLFG